MIDELKEFIDLHKQSVDRRRKVSELLLTQLETARRQLILASNNLKVVERYKKK